jgi:two-component system, OmpR family, sensor histidine kinase KdpD
MNSDARRNPDELLTELQRREALEKRGRLKIFFGASAGVGKTYAMLESARLAKAAGADIVAGYVEPHGRAETERLLHGLEQLPFLEVRYRGITRREFDLDAALKRRPAIILVDELAHSNLVEGEPRPRHAKRWQDINELLDAGIDVWTTLNVQHLESLNDVVASITGVRQQETVPDGIFDEADEVKLIDLPPTDLLQRLRAGKVYQAGQAATASERFFKEPNLLALREMALRRTADRVDAAARAYGGQRERASKPWLARDRFLIAVALDDQAEQLVRVGKRFADALDAEWIVVSVETPSMLRLGEAARNRRIDVLRLAESLGAEAVTLDGPSASAALTEYARLRNITRIVVGEPRRFGWRSLLRPSTATKLVRAGGGFDVSVIARREAAAGKPAGRDSPAPSEIRWSRYGAAILICLACTGVAALMVPYFSLTNLVMVYLLGATIAALRLGRGPASVAAVLNVAIFDFCFVAPRFTLAVADFEYVVTFAVMLAVALIIATLVANVRAQTRVAGARERRTALLYGMSRELAATRSLSNLARVAVKHVAETFASRAVVLVPEDGRLRHPRSAVIAGSLRGADLSIAQWVFDHGAAAGLGTDTLPGAPAQYLPLKGTRHTLGVLAVQPSQRRRLLLPEQRHLLETFAGQIALALERAELAEEAEVARVTAETESLRNTLLASISHDLRTPLAVIAGASSALNDRSLRFDEATRAQLTASIEDKAREMSDIISNVLDLMRFEAGQVALRRDWESLDDLVGAALHRVQSRTPPPDIAVDVPADLPPVFVDAPLVTQVLANLLENACRHTPPGTRIFVTAAATSGGVRVSVEDEGPGLPPGDPERLFAKFQRGRDEGNTGGAGLGLAICRAIIVAHGGTIAASQRPAGGARFVFTLPTESAGPPA